MPGPDFKDNLQIAWPIHTGVGLIIARGPRASPTLPCPFPPPPIWLHGFQDHQRHDRPPPRWRLARSVDFFATGRLRTPCHRSIILLGSTPAGETPEEAFDKEWKAALLRTVRDNLGAF